MAREARGEVIDPAQVQVVHCIQRCVRRAFLCGNDPYSGRSYEHRRGWIRHRLRALASVFGIDCLTYTVMHNHVHLVLRSRPDVVASWSDVEVARRWLRLFPPRRNPDGSPLEASAAEIKALVAQRDVLAERRRRLSDISWWMKCTSEYIARRSNAEDEVTGHFWEGRYRSQVLLDEAGVLTCATYVDLNPIRAAVSSTPETSEFTGAKDRLDDLAGAKSEPSAHHRRERERRCRASGWLCPVQIDELQDPPGADVSSRACRASDKGFLSISLTSYLQLLDWTGRQLHHGKRGAIPADLRPILERIGLDGPSWCDLVERFRLRFRRAVGSPNSLADEACRRGRRWFQAPGNPLRAA